MARDRYPEGSFGALLSHLIREQGFTQTRFLQEMGISKTYLFDIFHGRVKAPNGRMQLRMAEVLQLTGEVRAGFLDRAAEARGEVPADIQLQLQHDRMLRARIREEIDYALLAAMGRDED